MRGSLAAGLIALGMAGACGGSDDSNTGSSAAGNDGGGTGASDAGTLADGAPIADSGKISGGDGSAASGGLKVVMGTGGSPGHIVDGSGTLVQLHGVDRSGTEDSCVYSASTFDTPVDQNAVTAMKTWNVNAVRVPLNEDCWLGINQVMTGGSTYRDAIKAYVELLTSNNLIVILDLHWAAPGTEKAQGQLGMADADHAPTFWTQVATAYGNQPNVIFDLFNEPFITDWGCWLTGGTCAKDYNNADYESVGMATLIKTVRATGANNVLILGGLGYSANFAEWVAKVKSIPTLPAPNDGISLTNIAASWHTYSSQSADTSCPGQYDGYSGTCANGATTASNYGITGVLGAGFPVVIGEIGTDTYASSTPNFTSAQATMLDGWLESVLTSMDGQGQGYLGWDWNTSAPPLLITNFDGTPTPHFGTTFKAHLLTRPK